MGTKDLVMLLAILVLLITTIIFGVRSSTNAAKAQEAENMSTVLVDVLRGLDYPKVYPACRAISPGKISVITRCLEDSLVATDLSAMFREDQFKDFDARKNGTGYLIIENAKGGRSFDSRLFTLSQNNVEIATGCATPGTIEPGFTCRFDLGQECVPGDNLEVAYEGKRAFLKTC